MSTSKNVALALLLVTLISLTIVHSVHSQSTGTIFINADGSVSGTSKIQHYGNLYRVTDDIFDFNIVVQCNNIILDGSGFALQGEGGWAPGVEGKEDRPAINLTCSKVTIQNFNIIDWKVGILGDFNNNTIFDNIITQTVYCIAIYADHYVVTRNHLENSIYGVRVKGNYNSISENQILNNYGGFLISSSLGIVIVENNIANNTEMINVDYDSGFEVYHNNFINGENTRIASTISDALPGLGAGGGIMPPWDNGKEGNYWSDYTAKYPNATETGNSGIGDTPYEIHVNPSITDRFPLMMPIEIQNITLPAPSPTPSPSPTPTSSTSPTSSPSPSSSPSLSPSPSHSSFSPTSAQILPQETVYAAILTSATIIIVAVVLMFRKR